jgi:hypothetical protein
MHVSRSSLAALLLGFLGASTAAGAPPDPAAPAPDPAAPAARPFTAKEKAEAIVLFRNYLDREAQDATRYRLDLVAALGKWREAGIADLMGDLPGLLDVIYKARPFTPGTYEKRALGREVKFHRDEGARITSVEGAGMRFSLSLPMGYDSKKANTVAPYPTILLLHDLVDFQEGTKSKEFPGAEAIRRLYPRNGPLKAVTDRSLVYAPVASRAQFDSETNRRVVGPFSDFWKRYHVDFDRVVLDGGNDTLSIASKLSFFFSGIVVRGRQGDPNPALVVNYRHLPVYVVGDDKLPAVKVLRDAGVEVTLGTAEGLAAWLEALPPRKTPTEFTWHVGDPRSHVLAHWISVNEATANGQMKVKADREKNVVEVSDAKGITNVALFLNDRIVDLSKPVKIVLNGTETGPAKVYPRELDTMFDEARVSIRASRYYGWLFPVVFERLAVPEPKPEEKPEPGKPVDEEKEADAREYFRRGEEAHRDGDVRRALLFFQKAVDVGDSSVRAQAEAKVKELSEKGAAAKSGAATK